MEIDELAETVTTRGKIYHAALACGLISLLLALAASGIFFLVQRSYNGHVRRISGVFPTEPGRPSRSSSGAENWLLVGSDRRSDGATTGEKSTRALWLPDEQRSDTLMLMHLSETHDRVSVISIPRDSWVDIPQHGKAKINAAFSYGGPSLLIRVVERLTGIHIDHFGVLDFMGFVKMTNALGGVDVNVAQTNYDPIHGRTWPAGRIHLNGTKALDFVRQRFGLPGGDFDRIKRQQAFLDALGTKVLSAGTLLNPLRMNSFLRAMTSSVTVDDTVTEGTLRSLAFEIAHAALIEYLTAPIGSLGTEDGQDIVRLDGTKMQALFDAVRRDQIGVYLSRDGNTNNVNRVR